MKQSNYHASITADITPEKALESISRARDWWASDFEGNSRKNGDVFTVHFDDTFVTFKIVDVVAGKKISWLVTDCNLHWLEDKKEWKGTKIDWEVTAVDKGTQIDFTHIGLVPQIECYDMCKKGWDFFIKESLFKFIKEGKGLPQTPKIARVAAN